MRLTHVTVLPRRAAVHPKCRPRSSEGSGVHSSTTNHFDELLGDIDFLKTVDLIAREIYHLWNVSDRDAHSVVLSAIGEPATLACVHAALLPRNLPLARLIMRRRVIDLLRKDARPNNHCSLSIIETDIAETQPADSSEILEGTPRVQLELRQVVRLVRTALDGFAAQGFKQREQAQLLRRYVLDDVGYSELSMELTCSKSALRVRVHKAMSALRKYVQRCHPELEQLLERRSMRSNDDLERCESEIPAEDRLAREQAGSNSQHASRCAPTLPASAPKSSSIRFAVVDEIKRGIAGRVAPHDRVSNRARCRATG